MKRDGRDILVASSLSKKSDEYQSRMSFLSPVFGFLCFPSFLKYKRGKSSTISVIYSKISWKEEKNGDLRKKEKDGPRKKKSFDFETQMHSKLQRSVHLWCDGRTLCEWDVVGGRDEGKRESSRREEERSKKDVMQQYEMRQVEWKEAKNQGKESQEW